MNESSRSSLFPHLKSDDAKDERLEHLRELGRGILIAGTHADDEVVEVVFVGASATPRMNRPFYGIFLFGSTHSARYSRRRFK